MSAKPILVVDDEPKIVEVVTSYLEAAGHRVVTAANGRQALEMFDRHSPALVVLDLMLPDLSGEAVCRAIRQKAGTPVIMLTARADEESALRGLTIGADDYVTKPFSPRLLVAKAEAMLRRAAGDAQPTAGVVSFRGGDLVIDGPGHEVRRKGSHVALTPNEFGILSALARHPERAFTREELISFAMGGDFEGYDRTIDTHVKNIRQKIEDDPKSPRYVLTVYGVGYRFGGGSNEAQPQG